MNSLIAQVMSSIFIFQCLRAASIMYDSPWRAEHIFFSLQWKKGSEMENGLLSVHLHDVPVNEWHTEDLTVKPGFHLSVSADEGTLIQSCAA